MRMNPRGSDFDPDTQPQNSLLRITTRAQGNPKNPCWRVLTTFRPSQGKLKVLKLQIGSFQAFDDHMRNMPQNTVIYPYLLKPHTCGFMRCKFGVALPQPQRSTCDICAACLHFNARTMYCLQIAKWYWHLFTMWVSNWFLPTHTVITCASPSYFVCDVAVNVIVSICEICQFLWLFSSYLVFLFGCLFVYWIFACVSMNFWRWLECDVRIAMAWALKVSMQRARNSF